MWNWKAPFGDITAGNCIHQTVSAEVCHGSVDAVQFWVLGKISVWTSMKSSQCGMWLA